MYQQKRIDITSGFLVVTAALYYLYGAKLLFSAAIVCISHELGHLAAIYALGGRVNCLRISCVGADLRLDPGRPLSYGREILAAFAGPAVNLISAVLLHRIPWISDQIANLLSGLNYSLCIFNMVPVYPLDGGRILSCVLYWAGLDRSVPLISKIIGFSFAFLAFVLFFSLVFQHQFHLTLLIAAVWLLLNGLQRKS